MERPLAGKLQVCYKPDRNQGDGNDEHSRPVPMDEHIRLSFFP